jgi:hypothetical protein
VTEEEIVAAARQFIRKVSGFQKPSKANHDAFHRAIDEVAATTRSLLETIQANAPQRAAGDQLLSSSGNNA